MTTHLRFLNVGIFNARIERFDWYGQSAVSVVALTAISIIPGQGFVPPFRDNVLLKKLAGILLEIVLIGEYSEDT